MTEQPTLEQAIQAFLDRTGRHRAQWARELGISRQRLDQILTGKSLPPLPLAILMSESSGVRIELFAQGVPRKVVA